MNEQNCHIGKMYPAKKWVRNYYLNIFNCAEYYPSFSFEEITYKIRMELMPLGFDVVSMGMEHEILIKKYKVKDG